MIRSRKTGLSAVPQMYHEELVKRTKARRGLNRCRVGLAVSFPGTAAVF